MQNPPRDLKRRIVPRWRSITRTPSEELENYRRQEPIDSSVKMELERRIAEWRVQRTTDAAQEFLWAAHVFGRREETEPTLEQIASSSELSASIQDQARDLMAGAEKQGATSSLALNTKDILQRRIRELKKRISDATHDPIQYIELARIYNRIGQTDQAKKALLVACSLAPEARFVLRAAARFFVHVEDYDSASKILGRADPSDPWLQAARISVLDLSGQPIRDIKRARAVLDRDLHPKHLSELAGALATLEFEGGNATRAKKLFKKGEIDPNDNVVAQLQWASQNKLVEFRPDLLNRSLTFEARAQFSRRVKKWRESLTHCVDWIEDEPFSVRPATLGSYLATEFLRDYDKSIELCQTGLIANPDDFTLLNNVSFSYASKGELALATEYLSKAEHHIRSKAEEVVFRATSGMINLRQGRHDAGASDYLKSIELAKQEKLPTLAQIAAIHYFSEVAGLGNFWPDDELEKLSSFMEDRKRPEEVREIYKSWLQPLLIDNRKSAPAEAFRNKVSTDLIVT
jgi:tetratricopeptide (TPR) repeat protein